MMNMNLKEVLKLVASNAELKAKFENCNSVGSLYDTCVSAGFEGSIEDFQDQFAKIFSESGKLVLDESLEKVAGGKMGAISKASAAALSALMAVSSFAPQTSALAPTANSTIKMNHAEKNAPAGFSSKVKSVFNWIKANPAPTAIIAIESTALTVGGGVIIYMALSTNHRKLAEKISKYVDSIKELKDGDLVRHTSKANDFIKDIAKISGYKGDLSELLKGDINGNDASEVKKAILNKVITASNTIKDALDKDKKHEKAAAELGFFIAGLKTLEGGQPGGGGGIYTPPPPPAFIPPPPPPPSGSIPPPPPPSAPAKITPPRGASADLLSAIQGFNRNKLNKTEIKAGGQKDTDGPKPLVTLGQLKSKRNALIEVKKDETKNVDKKIPQNPGFNDETYDAIAHLYDSNTEAQAYINTQCKVSSLEKFKEKFDKKDIRLKFLIPQLRNFEKK